MDYLSNNRYSSYSSQSHSTQKGHPCQSKNAKNKKTLSEKEEKYIKYNKLTFDNIVFDESYKQITHDTQCMFCYQNENKILNIKTMQDLKEFVCENSRDQIKSMLTDTNGSYGFTYLHYLFFSFAKERLRHRNPDFAKQAPLMIKFLASYDQELFVELLKLGKKDTSSNTNDLQDLSTCTPFHEYVKNLSYAKPDDIEFIEYMRNPEFKLDFDDLRDSDGFSFNDYIKKKNNVSTELADNIRFIQGKMKHIEKIILNKITLSLPSYFQKCSNCNKLLNLIEDLYKLPSKRLWSKLDQDDIFSILKIIGMRESIIKLYDENNSSTKDNNVSHQNMISAWKIHIAYIVNNI